MILNEKIKCWRISSRTKATLAVAKLCTFSFGKAGPDNLKLNIEERQAAANTFAKNLLHTFDGMKAAGLSQRGMVAALRFQYTYGHRQGRMVIATGSALP